ncbi:MAG TPA: winged helix-turn-helix transcriptional regulator [Candidatus Angelobacter sp.]|nr:winged helix-turn-helix transcriptional regulator [Candidatus Angelobacter sp.]
MSGERRRDEIWEAIRKYKAEHDGNSPSERELAEIVGVSRGSIQYHLGKLIKAGRLERGYADRRAFRITGS